MNHIDTLKFITTEPAIEMQLPRETMAMLHYAYPKKFAHVNISKYKMAMYAIENHQPSVLTWSLDGCKQHVHKLTTQAIKWHNHDALKILHKKFGYKREMHLKYAAASGNDEIFSWMLENDWSANSWSLLQYAKEGCVEIAQKYRLQQRSSTVPRKLF